MDWTKHVVAILNKNKEAVGTGFLAAPNLVLTCAHVVLQAGSGQDQPVIIRWQGRNSRQTAQVRHCPPDPKASKTLDVAVLELDRQPQGTEPLTLGSSSNTTDHTFQSFGYPQLHDTNGFPVDEGRIGTLMTNKAGQPYLKLISNELAPGISGGPVLDTMTGLVVGMVDWGTTRAGKLQDVNGGIPSESLQQVWPNLTLAPTLPTLPQIHVRFPYPDQFVGREVALRELHQLLQGDGRALGITPAGLTGRGGIGKTQLAVKYAYDYQEHYPGGVFLINATRSLVSELVEVAEWLHLKPTDPYSPERNRQMLLALRDYLQQQPQTLLIFDNVTDPERWQREPIGPLEMTVLTLGGRLLFTTRRKTLPPTCQGFSLERLDDDDAQAIIVQARPDLADDPLLEALCKKLDNLPLALRCAAAALRNRPGQTIASYLAALAQYGDETLHSAARVQLDDYHYANSLTPVLRQQWASLSDQPQAQLLFQIAGLLPEAAFIPTARLGLLAGLPATATLGGWGQAPLTQALTVLEDVYFIERLTTRQIRLHPLVRDFAQKQIENLNQFCHICASRLLDTYEDFAILEDNCIRRGIIALQEDLLTALELISRQTYQHSSITTLQSPLSKLQPPLANRLHSLLRLIQLEAHTLKVWEPSRHPAFFAQQVYKRTQEMNLNSLWSSAHKLLSQKAAPYLQMWWSNKKESLALERTLAGHEAIVNDVAVTPDGQHAVSASADRTLKVWNLLTGEAEQTLAGHEHGVLAVAISTDGQYAVSAAADHTLKVWNLLTGEVEQTLTGHKSSVNGVAVTPNRQRAISASDDGTLKVWNLNTEEVERTLVSHEGSVQAVAVTSDGYWAISASWDRTLKVWNLLTWEVKQTLTGHEHRVNCVAVTPNGQRAVSASDDHTIKVWNLYTGAAEQTLSGHEDYINAVAVTPDGQRIISASDDGTLKVWNLHTGVAEQTLSGHEDYINAVAVTPDGQRIISASDDGTLKVWNLHTGAAEQSLSGHEDRVRAVAVTPDGQQAVSASYDHTCKVWNLHTGEVERTLAGHEDSVWAVTVTPDGQRAVSASYDLTIKIWNISTLLNKDLLTGAAELTLSGHEYGVNAIAMLPDGQRIVSASWGHILKVWNLLTETVELTLSGHIASVQAVALTPDGQRVISASWDHTLKVWNLLTGEAEQSLTGHEDRVQTVAVTSDGKRAVSGSDDRTLKVWNLHTGEVEQTLPGHESSVRAVAISSDGQRAISASHDRTLKVWNLTTGEQMASITLDAALKCVAVAPAAAGEWLVVAGDAAGGVYCLRYVEP